MVDISRFSRVDYWSYTSVPIEVDRNGNPLSQGTAFFYRYGEITYLVTAWHVLSGRHYQTGQSLSKTGAWPTHVTVWWNSKEKLGLKFSQRLPLHDAEGSPRWFEIKQESSWIDVAILPVDVPGGAESYPVNRLPQFPTPHGMGGDLFILGFPLPNQPLKLPIWKRASLSSEPVIPESMQPFQLVDTASRKGMSGSPVIQRIYHDFGMEYGYPDVLSRRMINPGHHGKTSFCGLYSGRFKGPSEEDIQLGIVWPVQWIVRLIIKHIGQEAYEAGLENEHECGVRALNDHRAAFNDPPYARSHKAEQEKR